MLSKPDGKDMHLPWRLLTSCVRRYYTPIAPGFKQEYKGQATPDLLYNFHVKSHVTPQMHWSHSAINKQSPHPTAITELYLAQQILGASFTEYQCFGKSLYHGFPQASHLLLVRVRAPHGFRI